ncbi:ead/Ea22-like family protein [Escherichia coli]|nr:ead/Ea22-like family protein [Escherichia coli]
MSKIDYQKLREIAEKTKIAGEAPVMPFDQRINALNDFMKHFSPDIALALLDELERNQQYIKSRDQENEDIALTVGKLRVELEGKDSKIANLTAERDALREGEMGDARHSNTRAAADIYFQLVEECEIPAGGSLVEYVDDMRENRRRRLTVANLQLAVKGEYFDAMIRGEKTEEYRLCNDYWDKRIMFREYDRLIITKGYPKRDDSSRRIDVPYSGYEIKTITHPHFGDKPVKVFAIKVNISNE